MPSTCIIFDIDGTLVDTESFEGPLYLGAVREVLGDVRIRPDWRRYEHVTDTGILRDICGDNGIEYSSIAEPVRMRFAELVAGHVRDTNRCPPVAGALSFWKSLRVNPAIELGIATGGWSHTACLKLKAAGYEHSGIPMASSDDAHERTGIMEHCRAMIPSASPTIYIGDGEWDMVASSRLGWRFIGVGDRLRGKCAGWIPDFRGLNIVDLLD